MTVSYGKTAAADEMNGTGLTGSRAGTILASYFRVIDVGNTLFKYVSDWRGKLPAGVCLSIRKNSHKVERGAATIAGTTAKGLDSALVAYDVDQIVFQAHDRIPFCGFHIRCQKGDKVLL